MKLTEIQKECIRKARTYKKRNFSTVPFGQLYMRFCNDGFVPANRFLELVTQSNVYQIAPQVDKSIDVVNYVNSQIDQTKSLARGKRYA